MADKKATGVSKTEPKARAAAKTETFAKEFLIRVDDASNVPQDVIDGNRNAVQLEAEQKGLRVKGEVRLESHTALDERNAKLVYSVDIEPATEAK